MKTTFFVLCLVYNKLQMLDKAGQQTGPGGVTWQQDVRGRKPIHHVRMSINDMNGITAYQ